MSRKIYDIRSDELRNLRKTDVDRYAKIEAAFGVYFTGQEKLKLLVQGIIRGEISVMEAHERLAGLETMPRPKEEA